MSRISPLWQIYNRNPETDDRLQLFRDPVGLRPPPPARGQDRPGVDHVALDPFGLQHPVDPEAVQTGLLDDDNREVPAGPRHRLAPELGDQVLGLGFGDPLAGLCMLDRDLVDLGRRQMAYSITSSARASRIGDYGEAEIAVEISKGEW
jgi:hypothetical protein